MYPSPNGVVTAVCALLLAGGCAGGGGAPAQVTAASARQSPALATMQTPGGVEVRTSLAGRNTAQLSHEFQEIDVSVAAFERLGVTAPLHYVVIDPARGTAPAVYQGDDVILTGLADPPYLPGFPEALGALAEDAGVPAAQAHEAVDAAKEAVAGLYVNYETTVD
jgi:hypothetical protein